MELAPDTQSPLPISTSSGGFKTPKAKRDRTKSTAVTVPTLSEKYAFSRSHNLFAIFINLVFLCWCPQIEAVLWIEADLILHWAC